ncbi:MAG: hypothetical protein ABR584_01165 [Candidatus Baltobacteraceae bacterium]
MQSPNFRIEAIEDVKLIAAPPLSDMYVLSPFVWTNGGFELLVRAVNHADNPLEKVARVYHGTSSDGLEFTMREQPAIPPGPGAEDRDGCEDPTVVLFEEKLYVFYTGWNQSAERGQLLLAVGANSDALQKVKVAVPSTDKWKNPKEATVVRAPDGTWRLFLEFARENASRIACGVSDSLEGRWDLSDGPVFTRLGWDDWHLSPGPVVDYRGQPLMFYNGATRDAKWRIGWVVLDRGYATIIGRCRDPLIVPPQVTGDDTDIAFAASALNVEGKIWLYYSISDKDMKRATLVLQ